jgi:phosphohistidine phosphatase
MRRELWLMRHAKAEPYDVSEDYDRALKKRGKRSAIAIAEWLNENALLPDKVISSPANRAISTANIVCDEIGFDHELIIQDKRLYDEGVARVKSVLAECPKTADKVLLIGHNPELEDLLMYLVNPLQIPGMRKLLPTAALVRLLMPDDWSFLEQNSAELLSITYPKVLLTQNLGNED